MLTDKGEFETLAHLRYAYLKAHNGNPHVQHFFSSDEWSEDTLHISELGKCPRQQMLRLAGAEKFPKGIDRLANEELMFWQGNMIHALTVGALDWSGILVNYERPLPDLPEGWSGHYDAIFADKETSRFIGLDEKTVRPNAFDYSMSWPKPEQVWQVQGYMRFMGVYKIREWLIEYIDRGGANTPQYRWVDADNEAVDNRMNLLTALRIELETSGHLPAPLEPEYTLYYRKVNNELIRRYNSVFVGPSWQCEWCPYLYGQQNKKTKEWTVFETSPCKPSMVKEQVGKTEKNIFKCTKAHHEESLTLWLKEQVLEYAIEDPDVD